jgi:hypothetical protein
MAILGACAIAGAAVGLTLALHTGSNGKADSKAPSTVATPNQTYEQGPTPLDSCIDSWNQNNSSKETAAQLSGTATMTSPSYNSYVNVGTSSLFPDRCLITVANASNMYTVQFLEDNGHQWSSMPSWTGTLRCCRAECWWRIRVPTE